MRNKKLEIEAEYLVLISRIAALVKAVSEMEALDIFKIVKWKKYSDVNSHATDLLHHCS